MPPETCAHCGARGRRARARGIAMPVYTCPACGGAWLGQGAAARRARERVPEEQVEVVFSAMCVRAGFVLLATNEHRRPFPCRACGAMNTDPGGRGVSYGIPDRLVAHVAWPPGLWAGFELKGSHTPLSPAQKRLEEMRRIHVVREPQAGFDALLELHNALQKMRFGV